MKKQSVFMFVATMCAFVVLAGCGDVSSVPETPSPTVETAATPDLSFMAKKVDDNNRNTVQVAQGPTVAAGSAHSVARKTDGTLWTWGSNLYGQLGTGDNSDKHASPVKVMDHVASVSAGYVHTAAITEGGELYTWGGNSGGQLGNGTTLQADTPVKIMDHASFVSAGGTYTAVLRADGTLWAWGSNVFGQLGDGTTNDSSVPVQVMQDVTAVSAGKWHTAAIKADGTLWTWGCNSDGQLGNGTKDKSLTPVKIMSEVFAVSVGDDFTAAIQKDGSLWVWGNNKNGQLGTGTTVASEVPVKVMENVATVSTGGDYTLAVQKDGTLWAWGSNREHLLEFDPEELESERHYYAPVKIMEDVADICAGAYHIVVLTTDGTLWTWGTNKSGQLGNKTTDKASEPIKIMDDVAVPVGNNTAAIYFTSVDLGANS